MIEETKTPKEWEDALAKRGLTPAFVENVRQEVLANGKSFGCTCEPFISLTVDFATQAIAAAVAHNGDCPLNTPSRRVAHMELDDTGKPPLQ